MMATEVMDFCRSTRASNWQMLSVKRTVPLVAAEKVGAWLTKV